MNNIKIEYISKPNRYPNSASLTVAVDRISIKQSAKTDVKVIEKQKKFLMTVAQDLLLNQKINRTHRGSIRIENGNYKIIMYDNSKKYYYTYQLPKEKVNDL